MSWFDRLKQFIRIDLKINAPLLNINITNRSNNDIGTKGYFYEKESETLHLAQDLLPKGLLEETAKGYIESGKTLFEKKTKELLYRLYQYNSENPDGKTLSFFKPIIPAEDFLALEASLFLRREFRMERDVRKLKEDIRRRFGDRGNNIANLCTAGYFEKFLIPLYNKSSKNFHGLYEVIIQKSPFALFVHAGMNSEEITACLNTKIRIARKYGIKFIHIHGISKTNEQKIKEWVAEQKKEYQFYEKKIYEKDDILILELLIG